MRNLLGRTCSLNIFRQLSSTVRSDKIESIVKELGDLNLLEVSKLVSTIKDHFNITDTAPVIAAVQSGLSNSSEPSAPKAQEKTEFSIYLKAIDATLKAKIIKEIKTIIPTLNLVEAKAFVESAPKLVKDKLKKEEAEVMKKALEAAGATVSLE